MNIEDLINKNKCYYSREYDNNDYINITIGELKDIYENKCGNCVNNICIYAPHCNFYIKFISCLERYYECKNNLEKFYKSRQIFGENSLYTHNFSEVYYHYLNSKYLIERKVLNIEEVKFKYIWYDKSKIDKITLRIGK